MSQGVRRSAPRVLVVFCSSRVGVERMALGVAVGVVQGRGTIRLRRLSGEGGDGEGTGTKRMDREYVRPALADVEWADAIAVCGPRVAASAWKPLADLIASGPDQKPRVAMALTLDEAAARGTSNEADNEARPGLQVAGLRALPALDLTPAADLVENARAAGRRIAARVRSRA